MGLINITSDVKEASRIIVDSMLAVRPPIEIEYRPYTYQEAISYTGMMIVDVKKIYPEAKKGNKVYIGMNLVSSDDYSAAITVSNHTKVFVDGTELKNKHDWEGGRHISYYFDVKEGENAVVFLCECVNDDEFKVEFAPTTAHYPFMWAKDYLLHLGVFLPIPEFSAEEGVGVSALLANDEELPVDKIEYVWPSIVRSDKILDFDQIFQGETGHIVYALTYSKEDTVLSLGCDSDVKVFVNKTERILSDTIQLKKGDELLLKIIRQNGCFGKIEYGNAEIGIPFLHSNRNGSDKWLTLGAFGNEKSTDMKYGPELNIQFDTPYRNAEWKEIYWKLSHKDDTIRPYLDSFFYGQWFYPIMIGHYGILQTAFMLDDSRYYEYFIESIRTMAKYFNYINYEPKKMFSPTFMGRAASLICLDNIGTMGMNMCELYRLTGDDKALYCIRVFADKIKENILTFDDGTYRRSDTMWADDMFMSCPFLVRAGLILDDKSYFEECIRQVEGFCKKLYMPDKKLFSHIFFVEENCPNKIAWGRGNGWIFASLADMIEHMPKDTVGYDKLVDIFKNFAEGLLQYQAESGLWHQVLDHKDSYEETSGTALFLWGISKGIKCGILSAGKYVECVKAAYKGILRDKIDEEGNVYGVCRGSGRSMDVEYYKQLAELKNDDHGTGLILTAFSAYQEIEELL